MLNTQRGPVPLRVLGPSGSGAVDALVDAVASEVRLLEDLIGILRRQRQAVASDDLQGVDDSVFATHRILVTLGEARRRRRSLNQLVTGAEDVPLRELSDRLGDQMTDELRFARDGLHAAALTLSREVEMNRRVLREAIDAGNEYVRGLFSSGEPRVGYAAQPEPAGGLLLNRRA